MTDGPVPAELEAARAQFLDDWCDTLMELGRDGDKAAMRAAVDRQLTQLSRFSFALGKQTAVAELQSAAVPPGVQVH